MGQRLIFGVANWRVVFALCILSVSFQGAVSTEDSEDSEDLLTITISDNAENTTGETSWSAGGWLSLGSWVSSWESRGSAMASWFRWRIGNVPPGEGENALEEASETQGETPEVAVGPGRQRCEPLTVEQCQGLGYNATSMPNLLNHESQDVAQVELGQYKSLISVNCSRDIVVFLCSLHAPKCEERLEGVQVPPCRPLCERVRSGCQPVFEKYGFTWPQAFDCNRFPDPQDSRARCTGQ